MSEENQEYNNQPEPNANGQPSGEGKGGSGQPAEPASNPQPDPDYPGKKADAYYTIASRTKGKLIQEMDEKCHKLGINRARFIESAVKYAIEEPHGDIAF